MPERSGWGDPIGSPKRTWSGLESAHSAVSQLPKKVLSDSTVDPGNRLRFRNRDLCRTPPASGSRGIRSPPDQGRAPCQLGFDPAFFLISGARISPPQASDSEPGQGARPTRSPWPDATPRTAPATARADPAGNRDLRRNGIFAETATLRTRRLVQVKDQAGEGSSWRRIKTCSSSTAGSRSASARTCACSRCTGSRTAAPRDARERSPLRSLRRCRRCRLRSSSAPS